MHSSQYAIILLAAGKSTRLGQPKQLLPYDGSTLIRHVVKIALQVSNKLVVVTGAAKEEVKRDLEDLPLTIVYNESFEEGIASSIRSGLLAVQKTFQSIKGVIFIVCDQPNISASLLGQLIEKAEENNKNIIACTYSNTVGTPVLFKQNLFSSLLELKGDVGAKKIIQANIEDVMTIDFPQGATDIDTKEDYDSIIKK